MDPQSFSRQVLQRSNQAPNTPHPSRTHSQSQRRGGSDISKRILERASKREGMPSVNLQRVKFKEDSEVLLFSKMPETLDDLDEEHVEEKKAKIPEGAEGTLQGTLFGGLVVVELDRGGFALAERPMIS